MMETPPADKAELFRKLQPVDVVRVWTVLMWTGRQAEYQRRDVDGQRGKKTTRGVSFVQLENGLSPM